MLIRQAMTIKSAPFSFLKGVYYFDLQHKQRFSTEQFQVGVCQLKNVDAAIKRSILRWKYRTDKKGAKRGFNLVAVQERGKISRGQESGAQPQKQTASTIYEAKPELVTLSRNGLKK